MSNNKQQPKEVKLFTEDEVRRAMDLIQEESATGIGMYPKYTENEVIDLLTPHPPQPKEVLHTQPDFICKNCGQEFNKGEETDNSCPNCGSPNYHHAIQPLHTQGELPEKLTLFVTGTGSREGLRENDLLLRTVDNTIHLHKEYHPGHLAHNIVDRYNEYEQLRQSNKELREALQMAQAYFYAALESSGEVREKFFASNPQANREEWFDIDKVETALNNTK